MRQLKTLVNYENPLPVFFCGEKELSMQVVSAGLPADCSQTLVHCLGMMMKHEGKGSYVLRSGQGLTRQTVELVARTLGRKLLFPNSHTFTKEILT
jgi:hypothetical protein